jgi:hypothetical protein
MATYAIPPQKGIADVLNEAADANERGMEGSRRSALTMSQLQGERQRQRFAEAEAGRQEKRFGFEVENQEYQRRQRQREEYMITGINDAASRYLFKDVERPNPNAQPAGREVAFAQPGAVVNGVKQPDTVIPPPPATIKSRVPLDLTSPEGLRGIADFQVAVFQARAKAGKVDQGEMNSLITFGNMLEQRGNRDMFRQALSGDQQATASLAAKLGMDPSNLTIVGGVDEDKSSKSYGFPNIFAVRRATDGNGRETVTRTPIGHLAALYAPEVYDAAIGKPLAAMKDQSTITYQGKAGDAAVTNANAAVTSANASASNARTNASLLDARKGLIGAQTDYYRGRNDAAGIKTDTATSAQRFASAFANLDGKVPAVTGAFAQHGSIQEWARTKGGLQGAAAQVFANDQFSIMRQQVNAVLPNLIQRQEDSLKRAMTREEKRAIEAAAHAEIFDDWRKRADGGELAGVLVNYGRRFNQQGQAAQALPAADE